MTTMKKIIDVHHHIIPKEYIQTLSKLGITKGPGVPFPKWDVETTIEVMDKSEISTAILSISAPGVYFKRKTRQWKWQKNCRGKQTRLWRI